MIVNVEKGMDQATAERVNAAIERGESVSFTAESDHVKALIVPLYEIRARRYAEYLRR